jgi:hypothetical protein
VAKEHLGSGEAKEAPAEREGSREEGGNVEGRRQKPIAAKPQGALWGQAAPCGRQPASCLIAAGRLALCLTACKTHLAQEGKLRLPTAVTTSKEVAS